MDPIAMCGSALSALNKIKDQLRDCEAAFEEAAELKSLLDIFEVTIMMIPDRPGDDGQQVLSGQHEGFEKQDEVGAASSVSSPFHQAHNEGDNGNYGTELVGFAKQSAKETAQSALDEALPLGLIKELFEIGKGGDALFGSNQSPAETMRNMKLKKTMGIRVHSDLEVMFTGMAFIISGALGTIMQATKTLKQMNAIGRPNCSWVVMPWKIYETKALQAQLASHSQSLMKQNDALSNAISVASYAVQLEQLENVLDATSELQHLDMKQMWKRKLGTDKTIVKFSQFFEVLLNTISDKLKALRRAYHVQERVNRGRLVSEIALSRYTNQLFNENGDDDITVYELASSLSEMASPGSDTLQLTANRLVEQEYAFLQSLTFEPLTISPEDDCFQVYADSVGYKEGKAPLPLPYTIENGVVRVRPFHRVLLRTEFPEPDLDIYMYDKLVLLRHEKNPKRLVNKSQKRPVTFELSTVQYSKCYLSVECNESLTSPFDRQWNAFKIFYDKDGNRFTPEGFDGHRNFEDVVVSAQEDTAGVDRETHGSSLIDESLDKHCRVLYVPYVLRPGFYSPRYCMDSCSLSDASDKQIAQCAKSYYMGNLACGGQQVDDFPPHEVSNAHLGLLIECVDEFEMVFAENEKDDEEAARWEYDSDEESIGSDEEEAKTPAVPSARGKKRHFRPQLLTEFPYLPDREGYYINEPKAVDVFINAPLQAKKKKSKVEKHHHSHHHHGKMGSAAKGDAALNEVKYGVFLKSSGQLIHDKAQWPVNKHNPLHRIRLHDEALEIDMDDCGEKGLLNEEEELMLRIGFLGNDNTLNEEIPYLDLIISPHFDSDDSSSEASSSEDSRDSEQDKESESDQEDEQEESAQDSD